MLESLIVAIFLANSSAFYSLQKITSLIPIALYATKIAAQLILNKRHHGSKMDQYR